MSSADGDCAGSTVVECHAGFAYPEHPTAFEWQGLRQIVVQVCRQWRTPDRKNFQVRTEDNAEYVLSYDEFCDTWYIQPA